MNYASTLPHVRPGRASLAQVTPSPSFEPRLRCRGILDYSPLNSLPKIDGLAPHTQPDRTFPDSLAVASRRLHTLAA